jgi:hypothetical protein
LIDLLCLPLVVTVVFDYSFGALCPGKKYFTFDKFPFFVLSILLIVVIKYILYNQLWLSMVESFDIPLKN